MNYQVASGLDIHKTKISVSIVSRDATESLFKEFGTDHQSLCALLSWLKEHDVQAAAMESTGKLYMPVKHLISQHSDIETYVVNPKYTRATPGQKTDKKDATHIARKLMYGFLQSSIIPKGPHAEIRVLNRQINQLTSQRARLITLLKETLFGYSIGIERFVKNFNAKSFDVAMNYMLDHCLEGDFNFTEFTSLLPKGRRKTGDKGLFETITRAKISGAEILVLKNMLDQMKLLTIQINGSERMARKLIDQYYPRQKELLLTIPGFGSRSLIAFLGEIGGDVSLFDSARSLVCWIGLAPGTDNSNDKLKSSRVSKAGKYLKKVLIQAAMHTINLVPEIGAKYALIKGRSGHGKAIVAIVRKLIIYAYYMLKRDEPFNPRFCKEVYEVCFDDNKKTVTIPKN